MQSGYGDAVLSGAAVKEARMPVVVEPMRVRELIEALSKFDPLLEVKVDERDIVRVVYRAGGAYGSGYVVDIEVE